jgi:CSLREA domain-containing protein
VKNKLFFWLLFVAIFGIRVYGVNAGNLPTNGATIYTVNTTDDSDDGSCTGAHCSLREAITVANADGSSSEIHFNIPNPPYIIQPQSPLPTITSPLHIDGETQNNVNCPQPQVQLVGFDAGDSNVHGLVVEGTSATIKGLVIRNFSGNGIQVAFANNVNIRCNFIGTDITGQEANGNGGYGVYVTESEGVLIGGNENIESNLISGNQLSGIKFFNVNASVGSRVWTNIIGMNADLSDDLGNENAGISLYNASNITVGGDSLGNKIAGNAQHGIVVHGFSSGNIFQGNQIGLISSQNQPIGNGGHGILLSGFANYNVVGLPSAAGHNPLQPPQALANDIYFNLKSGVTISDTDSTNNRIVGNHINHNRDLGIDLGGDGVTGNDFGDPDFGGNNLQNFPLLTRIDQLNNILRLKGILHSQPDQSFQLDFYFQANCDPSQHGEGENYLGMISVTTNSDGFATFTYFHTQPIPDGQVFSATATDVAGNTSEFSRCRTTSITNAVPSGQDHMFALETPAGAQQRLDVSVPNGAIDEPIELVYTTEFTPTNVPNERDFAGIRFDLDSYIGDEYQPDFQFNQPISLTFTYDPSKLRGVAEDSLRLYVQNEETGEWEDAALSCGANATPVWRPELDQFEVAICHLSCYGIFGIVPPQQNIYLPILHR